MQFAGFTIWTIGHSTHNSEYFLEILKGHEIEQIADIRSFPGSRRYPHFNRQSLSQLLLEGGVEYLHLPQLGGRRSPSPTSRNTAWRNASFRGYADYMETEGFRSGIEILRDLASTRRTAIMCAELLWWRCHRSLVADFVKAEGALVWHISDLQVVHEHPYTTAARIINGRLSYEGLLGGT